MAFTASSSNRGASNMQGTFNHWYITLGFGVEEGKMGSCLSLQNRMC